MMRILLFAILFCLLQAYHAAGQTAPSGEAAYTPVLAFDVKRDAAADIRAAVAEAQRSGRRVLVYVGGSWCPYCQQMEELFRRNPELAQFRDARFVTVAVAYESGHKNEKALAGFTKVLGIPHFFVLDKDGTELHSQHLVDLREGGDYSAAKMKEFFERWAPLGRQTGNSYFGSVSRMNSMR